MVWSRLGHGRRTKLPAPGACGPGRHTLSTENLMFYTPRTMLDDAACRAVSSDAEAQRWLGWRAEYVVADARVREALSELRPGDAKSPFPAVLSRTLLLRPAVPAQAPFASLTGVRLDDGRYAASVIVDQESGEIGGTLAPHARGRGLGAEMFRAAAVFAREHLGVKVVRAGHESANVASGRALARAGFVPDEGPSHHVLPNGREVDSRWLRHTAVAEAESCHSTGSEARARV